MSKKDLWISYTSEVAGRLAEEQGVAASELHSFKNEAIESAENGDASAQFFVGFISLFNPVRDQAQSTFWLNKAVDQGSVDALTTCGMMYYCGYIKLDANERFKAGRAFLRAADLGGELAKKMLDILLDDYVNEISEEAKIKNQSISESDLSRLRSNFIALLKEDFDALDYKYGNEHENSDGVENNADGPEINLEAATRGFETNSNNKFYVAPDLPSKKINKFLGKGNFELNENDLIFYFDDTVFGSGDDGVAVDLQCIYVQLPFCATCSIDLLGIDDISISGLVNKTIAITKENGDKINIKLTQSNSGAKSLFDAIKQLVELRQSAAQ